jgi:hypothetical protein
MTLVPARLLCLLLAITAIAVPAAAQDDPRFALVTSFPTPTIAFQWELSERFALRIEGSYSYRDESSDSTSGDEPDVSGPFGTSISIPTSTRAELTSHSGSIGVAGIFTIHRTDQLRLYVAPRVSVARTSQRITANTTVIRVPAGLPQNLLNTLIPPSQTFEYSSTSPAAGASFGAATNVHRRLALFGEAGLTWSRSDQPLSGIVAGGLRLLNEIESQRTIVNTRAVGGVMIFF